MPKKKRSDIYIKNLEEEDLEIIAKAYRISKMPDPTEKYKAQLLDIANKRRFTWLAFYGGKLAGHISINLDSSYPPFKKKKIPELCDLKVFKRYRTFGIGSLLLDMAEAKAAKKSRVIGLCVGLDKSYGPAQRIYGVRGFIPDGNGITRFNKAVMPSDETPYDDEFSLWLTKRVK